MLDWYPFRVYRTLTGLKRLLNVNEQVITLLSFLCVCLAGLADHCPSSHRAGHLLWHAHEQGSAWRLPQKEKAAIACRCRLKGNDKPHPKCPFLPVCLVWVWLPDLCISVWVVLCPGFCTECLIRQASLCSCECYWPQMSHWHMLNEVVQTGLLNWWAFSLFVWFGNGCVTYN